MIKLILLQATPSSEGFGSMMLPMIALLAVFYLFMILPQNRKRKKEKKFISEKKGSRVVTSSGIHGKLVELNDKDNTITIETGAGKIKFEKAAISVDLSKKFLPTQKKK